MIHPRPSSTTHTVEISQLEELNDRLGRREPAAPKITADELGMADAALPQSSAVLPGSAVLVRLCWDGAPEYPYIHGHFASGVGDQGTLVVDLHTVALRALSHRLHLHHVWGTGSPTP